MVNTSDLKSDTGNTVCGFDSHLPQKICKQCNESKLLTDFFKRRAWCKQCVYKKKKERLDKVKGRRIIAAYNSNHYGENKTCIRCLVNKTSDQFEDSIHCKSGKRSVCLKCVRLQSVKWRLNQQRKTNGTKQKKTIRLSAAMQSPQETTTTSTLQEKESIEATTVQ